jgi:hypothetical protein
MWESRRDFQRVWEGWEAGIMAFHAFHTLSFPWPAFRRQCWIPLRRQRDAPRRHEKLIVISCQ